MKLQKRLKWELRKSKQELGSFCKQFNYDPFKASTSKDCDGKCSSKPYKRNYNSKRFKRSLPSPKENFYKKPSKPYKKFSRKPHTSKSKAHFNYKESTCYKCGKKGHTVKYCRMNKKLHELDLSEEILSKITNLLIESSDSESSVTENYEPSQVDELVDSDTSSQSNSDSDTDSYLKNKKLNVWTKDQETFLELVKYISNPDLQKEYLDKLLKTFDKGESSKTPVLK